MPSMKPRWRLLDTGKRSAAENMALDDVILERRAVNDSPSTIRFLQFKPPAVLVGYHQAVEQEVRLTYCKQRGIDVNRRLTGGGAIYFDEESLGWEIFAVKHELPQCLTVEDFYEELCRGVVIALRRIGLNASFRPKNDIEVNGRKISGTGGTEREGAFLFQGTLLVDFDVETMLRCLKVPIAKLKDKEVASLKERVTCLKWELGFKPSLTLVKRMLKEGLEQALNVELVEDSLTSREEKLLNERLSYFQSDEWIYLVRRPPSGVGELYALTKRPGGLIRVVLRVDKELKLLKDVFITGDFFAYPSRAIMDLEAALKNTPLEEVEERILSFFRSRRVTVPGITPNDFVEVILKALEKLNYEALGLSLDEANHVYPILKGADEVLKECSFLLLPYCAKLVDCDYRRREGCVKCGKCSVGVAYELAEKADLNALTIQNFEHLMETLNEFKRKGVKGYLGCCCEAFICKHQEDLEKAGVPAVLVDIDNETCYDLGKELDGYRGSFESQTSLKTEILAKLLNNRRRSLEA